MNNKFSIGVVIAIVLQVSAFVWWTAQQAQTIQSLEAEMSQLTAKSELEKEVNLKRDVEQLQIELLKLENKTGEVFQMLSESIDERFARVQEGFEDLDDVNTSNDQFFAEEMQKAKRDIEKIQEVQTLFGEWFDEYDLEFESIWKKLDEE